MDEVDLKIGHGSGKLPKEETPEEVYKHIKELHQKADSEVLVISLCGLVGADLHGVADRIKNLLYSVFNYEVEIIKLSSFIRTYAKAVKDLPIDISHFESYKKFIEGGNELKERYGNSALAELAIRKISEEVTHKNVAADNFPHSRRKCYVIDSIKNEDEWQLLKLVYEDRFYSIGVFTKIENRKSYLEIYKGMNETEINSLIGLHSAEALENEQQAINTLIQSDFFLQLDITADELADQKLERFFRLVFGSTAITPTDDETAMYQMANATNEPSSSSKQTNTSWANQLREILSHECNNASKPDMDSHRNNYTDYPEMRDAPNKKDKAVFLYDGVAPSRYDQLFKLPKDQF